MNNLTATNSASLSFVAGANGAGTIQVRGTLTINSSATLDVNLTNYPNKDAGTQIVLLTYGTMPTKFPTDNIHIRGAHALVDQTGGRITLTIVKLGTVVVIR